MRWTTLTSVGVAASLMMTTATLAEGIDELPSELAAASEGVDEGQPIEASAYRDWTPRSGPPWTIG